MGFEMHAVARGTDPDPEPAPQVIHGMLEDGLSPVASIPQPLTETHIQTARRVIAFCALPAEAHQQAVIERWNDVPAVSENYGEARDNILERIRQLLNE
jgi:hypothetical protein